MEYNNSKQYSYPKIAVIKKIFRIKGGKLKENLFIHQLFDQISAHNFLFFLVGTILTALASYILTYN
jgi:hypothetical protein